MKLLVINIHLLINVRTKNVLLRGSALSELPILENAFLAIEDGIIMQYGLMQEFQNQVDDDDFEVYDAKGASVLPCWCDSHTLLVFAASRESEFIDKIKGLTYAEIAANGGGILNSADKLRHATEAELFDLVMGLRWKLK